MTRIIYFDIASIAVIIPLLISLIFKKAYRDRPTRVFIAIALSIVVAALFEAFENLPNNKFPESVLSFCSTGYFIFRTLMPLLYLLYIVSLVGFLSRFRHKWFVVFLISIPYIIVLGLIISNIWTKQIFNYTYDGSKYIYHRGNLIYLLYGTAVLYLIAGLVVIIKFHKFFNNHQFIFIFAIFPITLVSLVVQFIYPRYLVELFATAISLILVSESVEAPDEIIDNKTGLISRGKYIDSVYKNFELKLNGYYVLMRIINYHDIYNLLTVDDANSYIEEISSLLNKRYRNIAPFYYSYYLDDGLFLASFSSFEEALEVSVEVKNDMTKSVLVKYDFIPKCNICVIDLLKDFKKYSDYISFLNNYQNSLEFVHDYTILSEVINNKEFIIKNNISQIIDEAINNDEFEVYYQPIYNVKTKKFESAEALVRLNSKKYGFIMPSYFIEYAERNGKIIKIDSFVMEEVCKFIASDTFKKLGLEYIEVNISIADCQDVTLSTRIKELMTKYSVSPDNINIEITESFDTEYSSVEGNIKDLCNHGIKFSLDDYGTGFSNVFRFVTLPIEFVKIDKILADNYDNDKIKKIIRNTFNMITDSNRKIIVEGVETKDQLDKFIEYGCDYIQGYYFSKPLDKESFIKFIEGNL